MASPVSRCLTGPVSTRADAGTDCVHAGAAEWARGREHRVVQAALIAEGWSVCGIGDWAITLRCADGHSAARVAPFDPAYPVFVELCRRTGGSPYLPAIRADVDLDGGGQLTLMDFLPPAPPEVAARVARSWAEGDDPELAALRTMAEELDAQAARTRPWWDQIDLNDGNIRLSDAGHPVLIDLFCADGAAIYAALLEDPAELARWMPQERRRHMAEIAYVTRNGTPEEIATLREAVAVLT